MSKVKLVSEGSTTVLILSACAGPGPVTRQLSGPIFNHPQFSRRVESYKLGVQLAHHGLMFSLSRGQVPFPIGCTHSFLI